MTRLESLSSFRVVVRRVLDRLYVEEIVDWYDDYSHSGELEIEE